MELSRRRLRKKSGKRFRNSSSWITASEFNDAAKDTETTPDPPSREKYDSAQRYYDLPIPSRNAIPDNYEHKKDKDKQDDKVAPRTLHPCPILSPARQMIVPIGNMTYPYLPKRRFLATTSATATTTNTRKKLGRGHLGHRGCITTHTT